MLLFKLTTSCFHVIRARFILNDIAFLVKNGVSHVNTQCAVARHVFWIIIILLIDAKINGKKTYKTYEG